VALAVLAAALATAFHSDTTLFAPSLFLLTRLHACTCCACRLR
jgi:hypothetical protein